MRSERRHERRAASTAGRPAVAASVYARPVTGAPSRRGGTAPGSEVCVPSRIGVAWSGIRRIRCVAEGRQRLEQRADDLAVPRLERGDLLPRVLLVAGFVGRLDVEQEEVAVLQASRGTRRAARRSRCRSPALAPGTSSTSMSARTPRPRTRSTADVSRPSTPKRSANRGRRRANALAPQPDLGRDRFDTRGGVGDDRARCLHQRGRASRRRDRSASVAGLPVRSCGGTHSASAQSSGVTTRWRYSTPGVEANPVAAAAERLRRALRRSGGSARSRGARPRSRPSCRRLRG